MNNFNIETNDNIIEFIQYILSKYPLPSIPNKTIKENLKKDAISFIDKLSTKYSPKKFKKKDKINYEIYNAIYHKLNNILLMLNKNEIQFS